LQREPRQTFFAIKELQPGDREDRQKVVKNWELEAKALQKMNSLNQKHIVRFITAFRRGQTGKEDHYLMFEWADGGNLRNLWKTIPQPSLSAKMVKSSIKQLLGLAQALCAAHYLNTTGASYRHGDLKPENILWFKGDDGIGTLKLGDWGVAKQHNIVTELRTNKTTTEYGTWRYEAPEVETGVRLNYLGQTPKRRSRLYDIWAMGCISLEFIIWLLYGLDELKRFNRSVRGEFSDHSPFYQIRLENGKKVARVHDVAVQWMDHMAKEPACKVGSTALGDLLDLVRGGLLVVKLPRRMGSNLANMGTEQPQLTRASARSSPDLPDNASDHPSPEPAGPQEPQAEGTPSIDITLAEPVRVPVQPEPEPEGRARILATDFQEALDHILGEDEEDSYWFTDILRSPVPGSSDDSSYTPARNGSEYHTEDTAGNMPTTRPPRDGSPAAGGLVVPKQERVWAAFAILCPSVTIIKECH
jgi:serine/threonine protein kinase